ncbi:hypothetical protein GH733_019635 [Mirounga leonina]|nr:hypothetical protein GH733_019635 [Mirounga leonina]
MTVDSMLTPCSWAVGTAQDVTGPIALPLGIFGIDRQLTCTLSRDISVGGSNIYRIQQQPGSPTRDQLYYSSDSDKHQGSGVPSPFSGSKDASANAGLLRISGLQAEAEADYHWATASAVGASTNPHSISDNEEE